MQLSTEVTLPRDCVPAFPNKCIVCHCVPDSKIKVAQNHHHPFLRFFVPLLEFFGWSRVAIPVCRACKLRYRAQRWGRTLFSFALILVACFFIWPLFKNWASFPRKIVAGALVLLAISPYVLLEVLWPPYFDTTARKDSVDYEFASPEYAAEFHALNEANVLKSEIPE